MIKLAQNNIVIVMLMLVAFIGQAMASTAMSYVNASCAHEMNAEMSMMNHASMMSDPIFNEAKQPMDCCKAQCKCPMNGCASLSLLVDMRFNSVVITAQKISQTSSLQPLKITSSLYRPPIS